jgi:hypothetical protein
MRAVAGHWGSGEAGFLDRHAALRMRSAPEWKHDEKAQGLPDQVCRRSVWTLSTAHPSSTNMPSSVLIGLLPSLALLLDRSSRHRAVTARRGRVLGQHERHLFQSAPADFESHRPWRAASPTGPCWLWCDEGRPSPLDKPAATTFSGLRRRNRPRQCALVTVSAVVCPHGTPANPVISVTCTRHKAPSSGLRSVGCH